MLFNKHNWKSFCLTFYAEVSRFWSLIVTFVLSLGENIILRDLLHALLTTYLPLIWTWFLLKIPCINVCQPATRLMILAKRTSCLNVSCTLDTEISIAPAFGYFRSLFLQITMSRSIGPLISAYLRKSQVSPMLKLGPREGEPVRLPGIR